MPSTGWNGRWERMAIRDHYGPEGFLAMKIDNIVACGLGDRCASGFTFIRGFKWRIFCSFHMLEGTNEKVMAIFVELLEPRLRRNFIINVEGVLAVERPGHQPFTKRLKHTFDGTTKDWGFVHFITISRLANPANGYIRDGHIKVMAYLTVDLPIGNRIHWNTKTTTGYNGLVNQGATCYMNALLQCLFTVAWFRKVVYDMDHGEAPIEVNIVLALQRLFAQLQLGRVPAETKELTTSFGWDQRAVAIQQDGHEFCRLLLENLETKMKDTNMELAIPRLFKGQSDTIIECVDIDFSSNKTCQFYDVQLPVHESNSFEEAFEKLTAPELLNGDNRYNTEAHGLQDANKTTIFTELPPVLHIQLMRFLLGRKTQNVFSFPEQTDMSPYCKLSETLTAQDCIYSLHSVLVHIGGLNDGHYVTYVNTTLHALANGTPSKWVCFDDDNVYSVRSDEAINGQFGGHGRSGSAYLLVYVRNNVLHEAVCPPRETEIPRPLCLSVRALQAGIKDELRQKEADRQKAHFRLFTNEIANNNHGMDIFPLHVAETLPLLPIYRKLSTAELYAMVQQIVIEGRDFELTLNHVFVNNVEEERRDRKLRRMERSQFKFRLWRVYTGMFSSMMANRRLTSFVRPVKYIPFNLDLELGVFFTNDQTIVYVEPTDTPDQYDIQEELLYFIKFYNSQDHSFRMCGNLILHADAPFNIYFDVIHDMVGVPRQTELIYYVEHAPNFIDTIDTNATVATVSSIQDGSLLVVEVKETSTEERCARTKLEELYNKMNLSFHRTYYGRYNLVEAQHVFSHTFDRQTSLGDVRREIARRIEVEDATTIAIWVRNEGGRWDILVDDYEQETCTRLQRIPFHDPVRYKQYLVHFDVMDFSLNEIYVTRTECLLYFYENNDLKLISVFPHVGATVGQLLVECEKYFNFSDGGSGRIRLLEIGGPDALNQMIHRIFKPDFLVENMPSWRRRNQNPMSIQLLARCEEIPNDQANIGDEVLLVPVITLDEHNALADTCHLVRAIPGEPNATLKERLLAHMKWEATGDAPRWLMASLPELELVGEVPDHGNVDIDDYVDDDGVVVGLATQRRREIIQHEDEGSVTLKLHN